MVYIYRLFFISCKFHYSTKRKEPRLDERSAKVSVIIYRESHWSYFLPLITERRGKERKYVSRVSGKRLFDVFENVSDSLIVRKRETDKNVDEFHLLNIFFIIYSIFSLFLMFSSEQLKDLSDYANKC